MDAWSIQHAKQRDYTFHSSVHGTYSRIDFFLVEHKLLETVINTNIEISTFANHAPVIMRIKIEGNQNRPPAWRLNEELLQDKAAEERIRRELEVYFKINDTVEITEATLSEAHKA